MLCKVAKHEYFTDFPGAAALSRKFLRKNTVTIVDGNPLITESETVTAICEGPMVRWENLGAFCVRFWSLQRNKTTLTCRTCYCKVPHQMAALSEQDYSQPQTLIMHLLGEMTEDDCSTLFYQAR
jgi:hypothetical protein